MSLRESLIDLAKDMEEASNINADIALLAYAKQIRRLCQAASDEQHAESPILAAIYGRTKEDRMMAQQKERAAVGRLFDAEEGVGERMVQLVGGPGDDPSVPTYHPVATSMPEGAFTIVAGRVYQLESVTDATTKQIVFSLRYREDKTKEAAALTRR